MPPFLPFSVVKNLDINPDHLFKSKKMTKSRFLKDVILLSLTAFGGPQAHMAMFLDFLVEKRKYLSEEDLIELIALCQILPGPTSTQTITAVGYKIGGIPLALVTLLLWLTPAGLAMIGIAMFIGYLQDQNISLDFMRFLAPMAVAVVAFAAYKITSKVVKTKIQIALCIFSTIAAFLITISGNANVASISFPLLLILGGWITARSNTEEKPADLSLNIEWKNLILFGGFFVLSSALGYLFHLRIFALFENFYRNGSLIFGGGQVLIPLLKVEMVDSQKYLTDGEFLSGLSFVQAMPGPMFNFCGYLGATAMKDTGMMGQFVGGLVGLIGIFLPGTLLIFFVIRFWEELKKYPVVKASLTGVNAMASGLVIAAAALLFLPVDTNPTDSTGLINLALMVGTFLVLLWGKIPVPFVILAGLGLGFL